MARCRALRMAAGAAACATTHSFPALSSSRCRLFWVGLDGWVGLDVGWLCTFSVPPTGVLWCSAMTGFLLPVPCSSCPAFALSASTEHSCIAGPSIPCLTPTTPPVAHTCHACLRRLNPYTFAFALLLLWTSAVDSGRRTLPRAPSATPTPAPGFTYITPGATSDITWRTRAFYDAAVCVGRCGLPGLRLFTIQRTGLLPSSQIKPLYRYLPYLCTGRAAAMLCSAPTRRACAGSARCYAFAGPLLPTCGTAERTDAGFRRTFFAGALHLFPTDVRGFIGTGGRAGRALSTRTPFFVLLVSFAQRLPQFVLERA